MESNQGKMRLPEKKRLTSSGGSGKCNKCQSPCSQTGAATSINDCSRG